MNRRLAVLVAVFGLIGCSAAPQTASPTAPPSVVQASGRAAAPTVPATPTPTAASMAPPTSLPSGCINPPPDLATIVALDPAARLACFGGSSLTFKATAFKPIFDCGVGPRIVPAWFCLPGVFLAVPGASPDSGLMPLDVYWDPRSSLTPASFPLDATIQVTGHFDDPAAITCHLTSATGQSPEPAAQIVMTCRETFVVTSVH